MVMKPSACAWKQSVEATVNISGSLIKESNEEKLLEVKIDKKLNFKSYQ